MTEHDWQLFVLANTSESIRVGVEASPCLGIKIVRQRLENLTDVAVELFVRIVGANVDADPIAARVLL